MATKKTSNNTGKEEENKTSGEQQEKTTSKSTGKAKSQSTEESGKEKESQEKASREKTESRDFWKEAGENISEGSRVINEEAKVIGEKLSSYSEKIFGSIRRSSAEAYKTSAELTKHAVNRAQGLAEKYRDMYEMRNLNNEKKKLGSQLGVKLYLSMKNNDNAIPDDFTQDEEVQSLLEQIEQVDKKIIDLSGKIEEKQE